MAASSSLLGLNDVHIRRQESGSFACHHRPVTLLPLHLHLDPDVTMMVSQFKIIRVVAARRVVELHGEFRIPTLLKRVDRLCRGLERSIQEGIQTQA